MHTANLLLVQILCLCVSCASSFFTAKGLSVSSTSCYKMTLTNEPVHIYTCTHTQTRTFTVNEELLISWTKGGGASVLSSTELL